MPVLGHFNCRSYFKASPPFIGSVPGKEEYYLPIFSFYTAVLYNAHRRKDFSWTQQAANTWNLDSDPRRNFLHPNYCIYFWGGGEFSVWYLNL